MRQQIVVLTTSVTAFAMLLLALILQLVLAQTVDRDVDRVLADRAGAVINSIEAEEPGQLLDVPEGLLDVGVALYDDRGQLVAGNEPRRLAAFYRGLSQTTTTRTGNADELSRLRAVPFDIGGVRGVIILNEYLGPYEEAERLALIVSLVTGAITTAAASAVAAWATRRALQPVEEMARTAREWSEHDLGRRFDLGPPDNEMSSLAATLDTLLDKVSSAIRSEQRLTAELAHELRTPLTTIQGTADLMLLRDRGIMSAQAEQDLDEVSAAGRRMASTITALLELARSDSRVMAASQSHLSEVVGEVSDEVTDHRQPGTAVLQVDAPDVLLAVPHDLAVRTLSPVVANALRLAHTTVTLRARRGHRYVEVVVSDDGPGVDPSMAEAIFEAGTTSGNGSGAGLGLSISRRIARSVGGEVELDDPDPDPDSDQGGSGASFVVRLPLA